MKNPTYPKIWAFRKYTTPMVFREFLKTRLVGPLITTRTRTIKSLSMVGPIGVRQQDAGGCFPNLTPYEIATCSYDPYTKLNH